MKISRGEWAVYYRQSFQPCGVHCEIVYHFMGSEMNNVVEFHSKMVATFKIIEENFEPEYESGGVLVDTAQNIIFCCPLLSLVYTYAIHAPHTHTHTFKKICLFPFN